MGYYGSPSLNRGDYYRGDYYRGDYYRGDPGFFGNVFRAVTRTLGGAVAGLVTGGPLKAIAGAVGGAVSATRANIRQGTLEAGDEGSAYTPALRAQHAAALARGPVMPGGSMALMTMAMPSGGAFGAVRRQHPNRAAYVTRGGGTSRWPQQLIVHPAGSELVTSRRMNVGNARALRRALRRARGFAKLAHRVLRATRQFKGKGFGGGKHRAKR